MIKDDTTDFNSTEFKEIERIWLTFAFGLTFLLFFITRMILVPVMQQMKTHNASEEWFTFASSLPHQLIVFTGIVILTLFISRAYFFRLLGIHDFRYLYILETALLKWYMLPLTLAIGQLSAYLFKLITGEIPKPEILKLLLSCSNMSFFILFIAAVVVAPIVEEVVFRRIMFDYLKQYIGTSGSFVLTSVFFAAIHLNPLQFVGLLLLAIVLQTLYVCHKSLIPCILLHMFNNGFSISLIFVLRNSPFYKEYLQQFLGT